MVTKIKLHIFFATLTFMFGYYYLVDSLPRSRLIPEYLTNLTAAADTALAGGTLDGMVVEQPMFYLDSPAVSVHPSATGYDIRFEHASRRRCEQLVSNATVKQLAKNVMVEGGACGDVNVVTVSMDRRAQ